VATKAARKAPGLRPGGRRVGDSGTQEAILDAARDLFIERGYQAASMRAIASAAGVDPALIRHYFTNKETLFAATTAARTVIPQRLAEAIQGSTDGLGERVADIYLRLWEDEATRPILMGLARSATTSEHAAQVLLALLGADIRSSTPLPKPDDPRARGLVLASAHLFGVAVGRHILKLPVLTEMTHDDLVAELAPTIQRYITGTHK